MEDKLSFEEDPSMEENTVSGCDCVIQSPLRETGAAACAAAGVFAAWAVFAGGEDFFPSGVCAGAGDFMAPDTPEPAPGWIRGAADAGPAVSAGMPDCRPAPAITAAPGLSVILTGTAKRESLSSLSSSSFCS